jgi:hypothetical protein
LIANVAWAHRLIEHDDGAADHGHPRIRAINPLAKASVKPISQNPPAARHPQGEHSSWARLRLINAIARHWLDEIVNGAVTDAEQLAKRERCTVRQVNMTLSLAFLAPQLVKAAVEGRLPRGINIERLRDPHAEWGRQFEELGLDPD